MNTGLRVNFVTIRIFLNKAQLSFKQKRILNSSRHKFVYIGYFSMSMLMLKLQSFHNFRT